LKSLLGLIVAEKNIETAAQKSPTIKPISIPERSRCHVQTKETRDPMAATRLKANVLLFPITFFVIAFML
jgi:hypothetical protein